MSRPWIVGPIALALVVTLANAVKPIVVDDPAYLFVARQVAAHPFDPYGFELFWYAKPQNAMTVLAPPVLPYWLAAGIRIFGENVFLLKLWLFPFLWLLAWSLHALLLRFARGYERPALVLLMLSPAVLPMVNVMLDIPALALGLGAVALFLRAADRRSSTWAAAAGVSLALALQTKYTMLPMPVLVLWAGLLRRQLGLALLTVVIAGLGFAGWELFLYEQYGQSHFLFHLQDQQNQVRADGDSSLGDFLEGKWVLVPPFFAFLGGLGTMIGLWAGRAVGFPRWAVNAAGLFALVGVLLVVFFPFQDTVLSVSAKTGRVKLTLAAVVWRALGGGVLFTTLIGLQILLVKRGEGRSRLRFSRDTWFLAGWLALEIAGYFMLTPFSAGRRLIGVTIVSTLILARVVSRVCRVDPESRPARWMVPAGVVGGLLFALLDGYDAKIEKDAINRAADVVRERQYEGPVWFVGHWGFQYYADRAGMWHFVPGRDVIPPGEWLVMAEYPDPDGFYRPHPGSVPFWYHVALPEEAELVERIVLDDAISGMTVPNLYGGIDPIVGRDRPRMVLGIYRMKRHWSPRK